MPLKYVLLLLILPLGQAFAEALNPSDYRNLEFRDPGSQELLLVGQEETLKNSATLTKKTEYRKPEGGPVVARESSEYSRETLQIVAYSFADYQSGEESSVQLRDGQLMAKYRKNAQAEWQSGVLDPSSKPLGNVSIAELIERQLDRLKAGNAVEFEFYVPFKLTTFAFQLIRRGSDPGMSISVEPANWLIRQFVKKARFVLEEQGSQLKVKQFVGPSHIEIKGEANREVVISSKPGP